VNGRFLTVVGVSLLFLVLARGALTDGAYLRTDDRRKTFVWNNDPQPGDAATWSGGRDSEGYAEGRGTLTWLRTERKFQTGSNIFGNKKVPISRYTGNMVHGKFEGAVVTVDHGRTYHATFADGQRKGRWTLGSAIAKEEAPSEERAESESAEKRAIVANKLETAEKKTPEPAPPAEGPAAEEKKEPAKTDARLAKTETSTGAKSADQLEEPATPSKPVTKKAALAPGAVRAIDQPGRAPEKKSEKKQEASRKEKATPKPEQPQTEQTESKSEPPAEGPKDLPEAAAPSQSSPPKPPSSDKPVDDSIRTLMGPPSSLHTRAPATSSPAPEISMPSAPASSPSSATPKLNAVQAMDIADIEARTRGYDLGEYQLPKAEYSATNDSWSVSYVGRDGEKGGKRLSVVVQDKSGKAEVKK
jgi:hypothetical protein